MPRHLQLAEQEGKKIYPMATEAEWEYASHAGATTGYAFGGNRSGNIQALNLPGENEHASMGPR